MIIFMRILGVGFLAISAHAWLWVLAKRWRARFTWRWKRGVIAGPVTVASCGIMFLALGAVFAFGGWLVPEEYLIGFVAMWVAGWLLSILGGRWDGKPPEQSTRDRDSRPETVAKTGGGP